MRPNFNWRYLTSRRQVLVPRNVPPRGVVSRDLTSRDMFGWRDVTSPHDRSLTSRVNGLPRVYADAQNHVRKKFYEQMASGYAEK